MTLLPRCGSLGPVKHEEVVIVGLHALPERRVIHRSRAAAMAALAVLLSAAAVGPVSLKLAAGGAVIAAAILLAGRVRTPWWLAASLVALCLVPESGREFYPSFVSVADILLAAAVSVWVVGRAGGAVGRGPAREASGDTAAGDALGDGSGTTALSGSSATTAIGSSPNAPIGSATTTIAGSGTTTIAGGNATTLAGGSATIQIGSGTAPSTGGGTTAPGGGSTTIPIGSGTTTPIGSGTTPSIGGGTTPASSSLVRGPVYLAFALFLLSGLVAVAIGFSHGAGLVDGVVDFKQRCGYAAVGLLVLNAVREPRDRLVLVRVLLIGVATVAAYGVLQAAFGFGILEPASHVLAWFGYYNYDQPFVERFIWWSPGMIRKPYSPFFGPNSLAGLLGIGLALSITQVWADRPVLSRRLLAAMIVVMLACLLFTYSRACLVGLMAVLLVFAAVAWRMRRAASIGALLLVLVAAASLWLLPRFAARPEPPGAGPGGLPGDAAVFHELKQSNIESRLQELRRSFLHLQRYPLLGSGFGTGPSETGAAVLSRHDFSVSNLYLEVAGKRGLLGLVSFLWCAGVILLAGVPALRDPLSGHALIPGLALAMGFALANAAFDHTFLSTPALACLFWIIGGLILGAPVSRWGPSAPARL